MPLPSTQAAVEEMLRESRPLRGSAVWEALGSGVGGCRWRLRWGEDRWFVKTGETEVLTAEADGLEALAAAGALRTPALIARGADGGDGYLVLEWLSLARNTGAVGARLGEALARQHLQAGEAFG